MKVRLVFWSAVVLAVVGAYAPEGALFYFFATQLAAVSAGLSMRRLEHPPRAGAKAKTPGRTPAAPLAKTKTGGALQEAQK
jgi:hypothetical protein